MSGFIDGDEHLRTRIGRLEILVAALLDRVNESGLSSLELMSRETLKLDAQEITRLYEYRLLKSLGFETPTEDR